MISDLFSVIWEIIDLLTECEIFQALAALGLVALVFGLVYRAVGVDSLEVF